MNRKKEIIEKANALLKLYGFIQEDYIVSLQGPTVILSANGTQKIHGNLRNELLNIGMQVL
jgi:hypothetical protein